MYRSAASVESWADEPIGRLALRDSTIEYVGGGTAEQAGAKVRAPGVDARPLPAWGLYVRHVSSLDLSNVRLNVEKLDARRAFIAEGVKSLQTDTLKVPGDLDRAVMLKDVGELHSNDPKLKRSSP